MKKIRIFVDYCNFDSSWSASAGPGGPRINWERFPDLVLEKLVERKLVPAGQADLRGITVYASTHPEPKDGDKKRERWLLFTLDQMAGYTVKTCVRQRQPCDHKIHKAHFVEKGVDTMLVCDLLSLAMRDLYELGVVVSDDSDLVPSIDSVQDVLDRQIVHVGFKNSGQLIRSAAWAHLLLDDMRPSLEVPRNATARNPRPNADTAMAIAMRSAGEPSATD